QRLYSESLRLLDEHKRAQAQLVHAEKLSAVGELASGVAHEINNPLTTILGQAHLLLTHPETTTHVRDRLGIVAEEAGRAARIVQNLLLFARHYTPERRPCSVADQARRGQRTRAVGLLRDRHRARGPAPRPELRRRRCLLRRRAAARGARRLIVRLASSLLLFVVLATGCAQVGGPVPGAPAHHREGG